MSNLLFNWGDSLRKPNQRCSTLLSIYMRRDLSSKLY